MADKRPAKSLDDHWSPNIVTAFWCFLSIRTLSALFSISFISDVDEVMNYWEPTHFLTYGSGFQTWEYSPVYALRSYGYIGLHSAIASFFSNFTNDKIIVFYLVRVALAFLCTCCETFFYAGVVRRFGMRIALFTFLFLLFSPGMFSASTTYLPSTFSMYGLLIAYGAWFLGRYQLAVIAVALATIMGWPFCVVLTLPLAFDCIMQEGFGQILIAAVSSLFYFLLPTVIIDYTFYKKILIAPLNIILYNVFSDKGPTLYGTEPWTFYFMNGFLNFNIAFVLALLSLPTLAFFQWKNRRFLLIPWLYISSFFLWFGLMTKMEHKEERFLFVIYHLICLNAGVAVSLIAEFMGDFLGKIAPRGTRIATLDKIVRNFLWLIFLAFLGLSALRIASNFRNYNAPVYLYNHLYHTELEGGDKKFPFSGQVNICVGKEWYRFPSNFFLPSNKFSLQFV